MRFLIKIINNKDFNLSWFLLASTIATIIVWYLYYRYKYRRYYTLLSKLNSLLTLPFIGNIYVHFGTSEARYRRFISNINIWMQSKPICFYAGPKAFIIIEKAHHIETILNSSKALEKIYFYNFAKPWIGNGLITAPSLLWKQNRKTILPSFNPKILGTFIDIFEEQSEIIVKKLKQEMGKGYFDVMKYVMPCTLDDICQSAFGIKISAQEGKSKYVTYSNRIMDILMIRGVWFWYYPDFTFYLSTIGQEFKKCVKYMREFSDQIIQEKRKEIQEVKNNFTFVNGQVDTCSTAKWKPFLQLLMENTNFTNKQISDEVNTMAIGGNDTTAGTISFTLLALAICPHIQEKVYKEIYELFGDSQRPIELTDLSKLKYLEMVIKETLRLFPIIPAIGRELTEEIDLDTCTLPKDSSLSIGIFAVHRDPEYWENPEQFNPDRFQAEECAKRHPYSFVPFGGGPRNCIGMKYAFMVVKYTVVSILRAYKLSTDMSMETLVLTYHTTLGCKGGHRLRIDHRNSNGYYK